MVPGRAAPEAVQVNVRRAGRLAEGKNSAIDPTQPAKSSGAVARRKRMKSRTAGKCQPVPLYSIGPKPASIFGERYAQGQRVWTSFVRPERTHGA